jgi:nicotinate-nucleotide adenylyltransferase
MAEKRLLFGGTFDPVHNGHLIVARALAEEMGFDRVVLVPTNQPPHKPPASASAEDRLAMLRLAVRDEPAFEVSGVELRRRGPSYTLDTLQELHAAHPAAELHWAIGADMLEDLPRWHRIGEVLAACTLVVMVRPPWNGRIEEILRKLAAELGPGPGETLAKSVARVPLIEISSTDVRRRVAEGKSIRYLVPYPVATYIEEHGLYLR